jgi:PPOX class probable F420-dependent enzyme
MSWTAATIPDRVTRFLATEPVVWLSTVRPDGAPHLVPIWYWWDGTALVVFSKPDAVKVRNLRSEPRVMLAVGDPEADFDVSLVEARAHLLPAGTPVPEQFFAKYAARMAAIGLDRATFTATYTQCLRIAPTRCLAWHGRTVGMPVPPPSRWDRLARLVPALAAGVAPRRRHPVAA